MTTNSPGTPTPEQIATAQWRFGLIAPVIQDTYLEVSEIAYYRRITEQPLTRPDGVEVQLSPSTLQKWTSEYRRYGFDVLIPRERADKGSTRVLTPEAEEEIHRVLEKFPRQSRSAQSSLPAGKRQEGIRSSGVRRYLAGGYVLLSLYY